jgi:hypothetical protein
MQLAALDMLFQQLQNEPRKQKRKNYLFLTEMPPLIAVLFYFQS